MEVADIITVTDQPSPTATASEHPHILEGADGERRFVLEKLSNDLFVRTGKQIIDACELQVGIESWRDNLAELWQHDVVTLAREHQPRVAAVYMIPRSGTVHVLFVTSGQKFDFELADELAKLNVRLRRLEGMYGDIEASQIPCDEVPQFVHQDEIDAGLKFQ